LPAGCLVLFFLVVYFIFCRFFFVFAVAWVHFGPGWHSLDSSPVVLVSPHLRISPPKMFGWLYGSPSAPYSFVRGDAASGLFTDPTTRPSFLANTSRRFFFHFFVFISPPPYINTESTFDPGTLFFLVCHRHCSLFMDFLFTFLG